jgi:hypothetical protein
MTARSRGARSLGSAAGQRDEKAQGRRRAICRATRRIGFGGLVASRTLSGRQNVDSFMNLPVIVNRIALDVGEKRLCKLDSDECKK